MSEEKLYKEEGTKRMKTSHPSREQLSPTPTDKRNLPIGGSVPDSATIVGPQPSLVSITPSGNQSMIKSEEPTLPSIIPDNGHGAPATEEGAVGSTSQKAYTYLPWYEAITSESEAGSNFSSNPSQKDRELLNQEELEKLIDHQSLIKEAVRRLDLQKDLPPPSKNYYNDSDSSD